VVDDDPREAEVCSYVARSAGFQPTQVTELGQMEDIVRRVAEEHPVGVLCDHRLQFRQPAGYDGATLVAKLTTDRVPAVLVTTFVRDADVSIRLHRDKIPVLLLRDQLSPESLVGALEYCQAEIDGRLAPDRKPYRILLRIAAVVNEATVPVAEAIIPNWNPVEIVRFPVSLIPEEMRPTKPNAIVDRRYLADTNVGAVRSEDLYFLNFQVAPDLTTS
jgi:CheY-like chemotaxis protein